ncbi:hypothetical protein NMY22_g15527 [Coprinellus aureogranulatus]|nr:hypothetical protein NMY22_g15527 [Coprinellus aureogranulatus]
MPFLSGQEDENTASEGRGTRGDIDKGKGKEVAEEKKETPTQPEPQKYRLKEVLPIIRSWREGWRLLFSWTRPFMPLLFISVARLRWRFDLSFVQMLDLLRPPQGYRVPPTVAGLRDSVHVAGGGINALGQYEFVVPPLSAPIISLPVATEYLSTLLHSSSSSMSCRKPRETLRVMLSREYLSLWKAASPAAFGQAWLDCVESHHAAYNAGKFLCCDINENNLKLVVTEDKVHGVVIDWDMAKGQNDNTSLAQHRTGTGTPFMAIDLLYDKPWGHLYRYDLESLFYILVWAAINYDLKKGVKSGKVHTAVKDWISNDMKQNGRAKNVFLNPGLSDYEDVFKAIRPEFNAIKSELIEPLYNLFSEAMDSRTAAARRNELDYDYETCGGLLTFEKFMKAIKVTPRWASSTSA